MIVRVQDETGLRRTEKFIAQQLSEWDNVRGIAVFPCNVPHPHRQGTAEADAIVWTPQACTIMEIKGFRSIQHGRLSLRKNGPWYVDDEEADLYSLKSAPNPQMQVNTYMRGVKSVFQNRDLPAWISTLVVLIPRNDAQVTMSPGTGKGGSAVVLAPFVDMSALRRHFVRLGANNTRWSGEKLEAAFAALDLQHYLPTRAELIEQGFQFHQAAAPSTTTVTQLPPHNPGVSDTPTPAQSRPPEPRSAEAATSPASPPPAEAWIPPARPHTKLQETRRPASRPQPLSRPAQRAARFRHMPRALRSGFSGKPFTTYQAPLKKALLVLACLATVVAVSVGFRQYTAGAPMADYAEVCDTAAGSTQAAPYDPATPSPTYFAGEVSGLTGGNRAPIEQPTDPESVQLIACLNYRRLGDKVATCQYPPTTDPRIGRTLNLFHAVYRLTLYSARTGQIVLITDITGDRFAATATRASADPCQAATGAAEDRPGRRHSRPSVPQLRQALPMAAPQLRPAE